MYGRQVTQSPDELVEASVYGNICQRESVRETPNLFFRVRKEGRVTRQCHHGRSPAGQKTGVDVEACLHLEWATKPSATEVPIQVLRRGGVSPRPLPWVALPPPPLTSAI